MHQGAFYRFKHDITGLVKMGAANQLEVVVSNESADSSVNDAERSAELDHRRRGDRIYRLSRQLLL